MYILLDKCANNTNKELLKVLTTQDNNTDSWLTHTHAHTQRDMVLLHAMCTAVITVHCPTVYLHTQPYTFTQLHIHMATHVYMTTHSCIQTISGRVNQVHDLIDTAKSSYPMATGYTRLPPYYNY